MPTTPIPLTILTGFLGAGKTTLLQRILTDPQGVRYGVLVNDFGAINIDAGLIVETAENRIALANGCICCSLRDDLVGAVERLAGASPAPEHILLEASGVSRPLQILDALGHPRLERRIAIDATLCLIDAAEFGTLDFAMTELALDQACSSDLLILNKCDLACEQEVQAVEETLRGPLPEMRIVRASHADVPRALLLGLDRGPAARHPPGCACGDHAHDHSEAFAAWSWTSEAPLDRAGFEGVVKRLPALLRAKGILRFAGEPGARAVFQLVGRRATITREPGPAPQRSELVALARAGEIDADALTRLLDGAKAV